jgi:hypothetical protein
LRLSRTSTLWHTRRRHVADATVMATLKLDQLKTRAVKQGALTPCLRAIALLALHVVTQSRKCAVPPRDWHVPGFTPCRLEFYQSPWRPLSPFCFCGGAFATARGRAHHTIGWKSALARAPARDPYADPAAPYKANRLSSSRERIINIPSQTTVITRSVMDDKNVTSSGGALRSTPGVAVGR